MSDKTPYLGNPQKTIEVIQKYEFAFQKKFGQNFLIDTHVLDKIISAAEITKDDLVVEIGPGIGTMTQYLACAAREVVAIEIDKMLIPILQDTLSAYDNVTIINEDVLKVDLNKLAEEKNGGRPVKVVANLPYYITTPIIMGLFENHVPLHSITIMVQKEVADRMRMGPGTKDYGALSLAVQYYAEPYLVANVPQNCFMPRPKIGSAVIKLTVHEKPPVTVRDEKLMFKLIRASFNQRRKTLANGLNNSPELHYLKEQIAEAIERLEVSPSVRGEALTLEQFAKLADVLLELEGKYKKMRRELSPDEKFMKEALRQAKKAYKLEEAPIGCVIVYEGKIIARGYNRRNIDKSTLSHAEILAIRKAAKVMGDWRLEGCTMYVTLEPCQMCAGAIVQARIDRVVMGSRNAKAGCAGSVINLLQMSEFNHQVELTEGILTQECSALMSGFFRELREKKKSKQSVDKVE